ncbi:MAG: sodium-dependent transporter, partial [Planctomycetota bacterium]
MNTTNDRARWSSRWGFIAVATGAAAGLGNIWKFPYIIGQNGGGAFLLVYLAAVAFVALPILGAELLLGRLGNRNVIDSIRRVAKESGHAGRWAAFGWIG